MTILSALFRRKRRDASALPEIQPELSAFEAASQRWAASNAAVLSENLCACGRPGVASVPIGVMPMGDVMPITRRCPDHVSLPGHINPHRPFIGPRPSRSHCRSRKSLDGVMNLVTDCECGSHIGEPMCRPV